MVSILLVSDWKLFDIWTGTFSIQTKDEIKYNIFFFKYKSRYSTRIRLTQLDFND